MKTWSKCVLGTVFAASLVGCKKGDTGAATTREIKKVDVIRKDERDSLVGRYGLRTDGKIVPFFRVVVSPVTQELVMEEWGVGDWQGAVTAGRPLTAEELGKLNAAGLPDSATAVSFGKMIFVRVSKEDAGKLSGSTGFALLSGLGPIELTPM